MSRKANTEPLCHAIVRRTRLPFGVVSAVLAALDAERGSNTPPRPRRAGLRGAAPARMVYVTSQVLSPEPCGDQACQARHPRHHCPTCARHYPVARLAASCKHGR